MSVIAKYVMKNDFPRRHNKITLLSTHQNTPTQESLIKCTRTLNEHVQNAQLNGKMKCAWRNHAIARRRRRKKPKHYTAPPPSSTANTTILHVALFAPPVIMWFVYSFLLSFYPIGDVGARCLFFSQSTPVYSAPFYS